MIMVLARNWWALALRGCFAILFGLAAFVLPGVTLAVLVMLFGAYTLIEGVLAVVAGVRAAERHERWWSMVLEGTSRACWRGWSRSSGRSSPASSSCMSLRSGPW